MNMIIQYDVVVAGAGPAGIGAALEAARSGAKVALIERYGCVGGNLTLGYVGPLMGRVCAGTMAEEIENLICTKRGTVPDFEKAKISLSFTVPLVKSNVMEVAEAPKRACKSKNS